mmetsp:Transcript_57415/g.166746  ORF Transcript_57415/g.166746 Transcript_57415/m.166746 type:complete len:203 (+) Transcript_57415:501-1109(+)
MPQLHAFVVESSSKRAFAASAIPALIVPSLADVIGDNPVEGRALVVNHRTLLCLASFACAEQAEIIHRFRDKIAVQTDNYPAEKLAIGCDIQESPASDGRVQHDLLATQEMGPDIPLAFLENRHDDASLSPILRKFPCAFLGVTFLPKRIVDDRLLATYADSQGLPADLHIAIFSPDIVADRHTHSDFGAVVASVGGQGLRP